MVVTGRTVIRGPFPAVIGEGVTSVAEIIVSVGEDAYEIVMISVNKATAAGKGRSYVGD